MPRIAIVTASDSGIGKATAVALAGRGYDVGVTWHSDEAGVRGTAEEVGRAGQRAEIRRLDLTEPASGARVVEELADALGGLDVLVNNAGMGESAPFLELGLDGWQRTLDVDLTGAFVCAQAAAKRMVASGTRGRIVNITSVHEHVPRREAAAYCAAKGGLGLLTKVMAMELAVHGITVNAVAPGEIATPMTGNEDVDPETLDRPNLPLGRPGRAQEIADLVTWLASEQSSYMTGASLVVDGGLMLMSAQLATS